MQSIIAGGEFPDNTSGLAPLNEHAESPPSPPRSGGEGRGEEIPFCGLPLSPTLSPLLRRGERVTKRTGSWRGVLNPAARSTGALLLVTMTTVTPALALGQTGEFLACRQWSGLFLGASQAATNAACLKLLFEDVPDGITRGRSWRGTPYQLGEKTYSHGIAFNSTKHILVRVGRPAERFVAEVGLENNDDTRRGATLGNGSVTFHVVVGGKEVFTSPVLRLKDGASPLDVPLHGAQEFEIRVKDAGDGRGWDQALWAEAAVTLPDGTKLRLQDLPWAESLDTNPHGFSFLYQGRPSAPQLGNWSRHAREQPLDSKRTSYEVSYRDPATGLEVRTEAVQFSDFPAVEWVVHFQNTGQTNTPMLESIQTFDGHLPVASAGQATLHWAKGAVASFDDFAPQEAMLKPGVKVRLQPGGGRSSSQVMPFFNIEGANGGVVVVLGWSGEWAAEFAGDQRGQPMLKAGMALTHLVLHPGESIRTPRMLFLFYEGDRWRGQNLLRQFLLAHHRPQRGGQPLVVPITCGNWGGTAAEVHLDNIQKIVQHDLPLDYYWIDAEWFGRGGWPVNVGDWEVKKALYPNGFKPLSDALRRSGRELMLWFEPERVFKNTPWHQAHRDWLLDVGGDSCLLNLGIPEAREFLTDFISARVDEFGLGCYRQDFNIDPLAFWRKNDSPDRQGITEIRYIEGLYAFWDELLARHPGLIIDNCASGGRRIDLETVGRATPFWRTDGPRDAIAHQCHTYGLLAWVPLSATSQDRAGDNYEFRSSMCSGLCLNWWVAGDVPAERIPANFPYDWAKRTLQQYLELRPFYYGDYYPLTSYSQARDQWMAYQLDRADLGQGLIVVLRRPDSPYESARLVLRGLDEQAAYQISNLDTGEQITRPGKELLREGISIPLKSKPDSALLTYERK
jgi:alpha-galactosidase